MAHLRIVLVSEYYYPDIGGLPEHLHHLAGALSRRGHAVTILTTRFPDLEGWQGGEETGVEVVRLGRSSPPVITNGSVSRAAVGLGLGRQIAALLHDGCFDVVHVHGPLFPVLPLLALRHAPAAAATVATLHTHFGGSALMRLCRRPLQRYLDALDGIIAVSPSAARSLHALGLRLQATIIENGVDLGYWQAGSPLPALAGPGLNVLVQARLEPRNHIDRLIAALGLLRDRGARLRLVVLGDGPLRGALLAAVPPALRDEVLFCGARIADRHDFARSCHVYAFTAGIASHPMSLLEGMAAGLPVVCHDIEGTRELVRDGVEGLLVPAPCEGEEDGGARAWAAALGRLWADEGLRLRLGQAARLRAQPFGWDAIAARIEACYLRVLGERGL